jgi:hypothetical protein
MMEFRRSKRQQVEFRDLLYLSGCFNDSEQCDWMKRFNEDDVKSSSTLSTQMIVRLKAEIEGKKNQMTLPL